MRPLKLYILLLVAAGLLSVSARGQGFNGMIYPSVTVQPVLTFSLVSNKSGAVNFTSATHYSDGVLVRGFSSVQVKSNVPWMLSVAAATPYFNASGRDASPNMPAGVLAFAAENSDVIYPLSAAYQKIRTGNRGSALTPGNTFDLHLLVRPGYEYGAGIYSITINYLVTAP